MKRMLCVLAVTFLASCSNVRSDWSSDEKVLSKNVFKITSSYENFSGDYDAIVNGFRNDKIEETVFISAERQVAPNEVVYSVIMTGDCNKTTAKASSQFSAIASMLEDRTRLIAMFNQTVECSIVAK